MTKTHRRLLRVAAQVVSHSRMCLLTTMGPDGYPRSRFMGTFVAGQRWVIFLVCLADSNKISQIRRRRKTQLTFWEDDHHAVVSLSGEAELVKDMRVRRWIYKRTAPLRLFPEFNHTFAVIRFSASYLEYLNLRVGEKSVKARVR